MRFWSYTVFLFLCGAILISCGIGIYVGEGAPSFSSATSTPNPDGTVTVTINGSGFVEGMTVRVNQTDCTNVHILSASQLTCVLPNGSIALINIVLTSPSGASSSEPSANALYSTLSPASFSQGGTGGLWSNMSSATVSDNQYAYQTDTSSSGLSYLIATGAGFSIPSTATITGITVTLEQSHTNIFGDNGYLSSLTLISSGSEIGSNRADGISYLLSTNDTRKSYGGNSDKWGTSLTPSIINANGFGVKLQYSDNEDNQIKLDQIQITIHYTN